MSAGFASASIGTLAGLSTSSSLSHAAVVSVVAATAVAVRRRRITVRRAGFLAMVYRIVRSLGQKVRRSVVVKLAVGGRIVWKPFDNWPTARISGSHTCMLAIGMLICPSRDVPHPSCCVHSMRRLRPATLNDALDAPTRLRNFGATLYVAESSRRRRKDARYV